MPTKMTTKKALALLAGMLSAYFPNDIELTGNESKAELIAVIAVGTALILGELHEGSGALPK